MVSIHAPTWGATACSVRHFAGRRVSIHAPTWGATSHNAISNHCEHSFNPRAHMGRDLSWSKVSASPFGFNPRAHVGRDGKTVKLMLPPKMFQSTRPRGARRRSRDTTDPVMSVSIHAPTWGATEDARYSARTAMFQSTRPRGARRVSNTANTARAGFNPRAHVGRD